MREVSLYKYIQLTNKEQEIEYHCFSMHNKLMSLGMNQLKERQHMVSALLMEKYMTEDKTILQEKKRV